MITLVETTTFKDGRIDKREKKFATRQAFKRALDASSLDKKLSLDLRKYGFATLRFDDARTTLEVIEDTKLILVEE